LAQPKDPFIVGERYVDLSKGMANVRFTTIPDGFKLLRAPTKQQKEMYATFGHNLVEDGKNV